MVNGMNCNAEITAYPLQEQFKTFCVRIPVTAKATSETQSIYKIKVYET